MIKKVILICLVILFVIPVNVTAQEPAPYSMLDPKPYNPETDPDIEMYMSSWRESNPKHTYGSLIERDILTKGEPMNPTAKGAVLKYINRFTYATLESHASTTPAILKGEQEIFYILSGKGIIKAGDKTADLYSGIAILIPANLEFIMENTGKEPLTMYLVNEPIPEGFRPNKNMLVKDENIIPVSTGVHWCHISKGLFTTADGLGTLENMTTCSFDPMTIGHPHSHVEGCEEVWTGLNGTSIAFLGKQIRMQPPGTAYMIPPDGNTPHSNINTTNKRTKLFYFARYRDHEVQK